MILLLAMAVVSAMPLGAQVSSPPRKAAAVPKPKAITKPANKPVATPATKPAKPTADKPPATTGAQQATGRETSADPKASNKIPDNSSGWHPYRFSVFSSEVMDSNIERDKVDPIASNGVVVGAMARYQTAEIRPTLSLTYEIARHSYTHSDQYDRVSHNLSAVASRRFMKKLTLETILEAAIKGSSEDRDVGDQYLFLPRLSYRLGSAQRLRAYGAYRIRRYEVNADRDAVNRYVGAEIRRDLGNEARAELGYRYETNSARAARRSYTRRTYTTSYTKSWGESDDFLLEMRYRSQRYDKRPVREDEDNPRHDHRLSPTVQWVHRFARGFSTIADYDFERRTSNDPDNGYRDHVFALTGRFDW